jgi:hypothetical protein
MNWRIIMRPRSTNLPFIAERLISRQVGLAQPFPASITSLVTYPAGAVASEARHSMVTALAANTGLVTSYREAHGLHTFVTSEIKSPAQRLTRFTFNYRGA